MGPMQRRLSAALVTVLFAAGLACGPDRVDVDVEQGVSTTQPQASTEPGAGPTTTEAVRLIEVAFEDGAVVGGPRREAVELGEKVRLVVTADTAEEVHVHTYDLKADVGPGQPAEITFVASIPGVHEVELEKAHKLLVSLEVR